MALESDDCGVDYRLMTILRVLANPEFCLTSVHGAECTTAISLNPSTNLKPADDDKKKCIQHIDKKPLE